MPSSDFSSLSSMGFYGSERQRRKSSRRRLAKGLPLAVSASFLGNINRERSAAQSSPSPRSFKTGRGRRKVSPTLRSPSRWKWLLCAFNHTEEPFKCRRSSLFLPLAACLPSTRKGCRGLWLIRERKKEKKRLEKKPRRPIKRKKGRRRRQN